MPPVGGGGGYSGIEWLPTAKWLRRAEVANVKKNRGSKLQTKRLTRIVAYKMCLFSLYFVKYMFFITLNGIWINWNSAWIQFCMRKFGFRGRGSATPKNRELSEKTLSG